MGGRRKSAQLLRHHQPHNPIEQEADREREHRQHDGDDSNQRHVPTEVVGKSLANAGQFSADERPHQRADGPGGKPRLQ